jgi:hypothetical protein
MQNPKTTFCCVYKGKATGKITTVEIFFDNAMIGTSKVEMVLKYFANLEGKTTFVSSITPDILTATWGNKKAQTVPALQDVFNQEASKNGLKIRGTGTTTEPLASLRAAIVPLIIQKVLRGQIWKRSF